MYINEHRISIASLPCVIVFFMPLFLQNLICNWPEKQKLHYQLWNLLIFVMECKQETVQSIVCLRLWNYSLYRQHLLMRTSELHNSKCDLRGVANSVWIYLEQQRNFSQKLEWVIVPISLLAPMHYKSLSPESDKALVSAVMEARDAGMTSMTFVFQGDPSPNERELQSRYSRVAYWTSRTEFCVCTRTMNHWSYSWSGAFIWSNEGTVEDREFLWKCVAAYEGGCRKSSSVIPMVRRRPKKSNNHFSGSTR